MQAAHVCDLLYGGYRAQREMNEHFVQMASHHPNQTYQRSNQFKNSFAAALYIFL